MPGEIPGARVQQRTVELERTPVTTSDVMKSGLDACEIPYAGVNGLITDLIPDEG